MERYVTRAADGRQLDKDLTQCAHVHNVTGSYRCARHVLCLGQVREALDALVPGLTHRAGRTDAAPFTSSHVLSPGMCWVVDETDLELVTTRFLF